MSEFISAEEIYAIVKEELNSYFAANVVNDLMFPKWTQDCVAKLKKSSLPLKSAVISLDNFIGELPSDFDSIKEVWACGLIGTDYTINPSSRYYQVDCRITDIEDKCNECFDQNRCECHQGYPDKDERYRVTHKVTGVTEFDYYLTTLLRPGNKNAMNFCHGDSPNLRTNCLDTFDIQDCKISTSFRGGVLHIKYYSTNIDDSGELLVPNDPFTKEYLIKYLKYKVFEMLSNTVSDESFNMVMQKLQMARQEYYQAKIIAETELKKWDKQKVGQAITQRRNRFNNFRRSLR